MEEVLAKIIEKGSSLWKKDPSELGADTTFDSMNAKSTHISSMCTFLEDEFDVEISYMDFKRRKTFGEAAEYVAGLLEE